MGKKLSFILILGLAFALITSAYSTYKKNSVNRVLLKSSEEITEDSQYNFLLFLLLRDPQCTNMNEQEVAQASETLNVLKVFPETNGMHVAAIKYFSTTQYRDSKDYRDKPEILCFPDEIKSAIKNQIIKERNPLRETADPDYIRLVFMLNSDDKKLLNLVENTAFYKEGVYTSTGDIRPLARLILSKYKNASSEWGNQASREISNKNKLGTSSAAIAAAAGNEEAIRKISELIDDMISESGNNAIKYNDNSERLYELVVAMSLGREKAQPYIETLIRLLNHKIESPVPPFGIIKISPGYVCDALKKIDSTLPILRSEICLLQN